MKGIYRRTSIVSFISGIGAIILGAIFYFYGYESFTENGDILVEIGLIALIAIGAGFYFKSAYEKISDGTAGANDSLLNLESLNELNFQRVPALLPRMYNVDSNGEPLFTIEPSKGHLSRWLTVITLFEKGFIIPVHYDILDMNGQQIAKFTIRDNVKRYEMSLRKLDGTLMSTYVQRLSKSALKNRGLLHRSDGSVWRELEAKSIAGDIDVKDEEGRMTASYRFGIFPYAMKPAFVSTAHHEHVRFGPHISSDEKLAYTMIFFLWLKG